MKKQISKLNQDLQNLAKPSTNQNELKEEASPTNTMSENPKRKSSSIKFFSERRDENLEFLTKNVVLKEVNKNAKLNIESLSNNPFDYNY